MRFETYEPKALRYVENTPSTDTFSSSFGLNSVRLDVPTPGGGGGSDDYTALCRRVGIGFADSWPNVA
jgi:hypothetical protein